LGNYDAAALLWAGPAIQTLRFDRSFRSILQIHGFLRGDTKPAMVTLLDLPKKLTTQAEWESELAFCLLESGIPDSTTEHPEGAAAHFTKALSIYPEIANRPIIAYYLEMMGKPVPPTTAEKEKAQAASVAKKVTTPDSAAADKDKP